MNRGNDNNGAISERLTTNDESSRTGRVSVARRPRIQRLLAIWETAAQPQSLKSWDVQQMGAGMRRIGWRLLQQQPKLIEEGWFGVLVEGRWRSLKS